jgi:hypothetical protein
MRTTIAGLALAGNTRTLSGLAVTLALGFIVSNGASAQQASDEGACALPFAFPAEAVEARILMVNEGHGTHESFRLAGELACTFSQSGAPVTVAIEMSRAEQEALDAYMASDGGEVARSALISRPHWETNTLANVAVLAMIERLRAMRRSGASLSLSAIDASPADLASPPTLTPEQEEGLRAYVRRGLGDGPEAEAQLPVFRNMIAVTTIRDRIMAELVGDAARRDPGRRFVVLLGGAHISKLSGVPFPGVDSMASILVSEGMELTSLMSVHLGGSFWGCLITGGNCGPHEFPEFLLDPRAAGLGPGVHMSDEFPGYDGMIVFERVTPAEPANPKAAVQASTPQR